MARQVASRWFESRRIDDSITLITEPHAASLIQSNIWHVRGLDRDLVVDAGLGLLSLRAHLPVLFERRAIAVATHTHHDHIGGMHEFDERAVHPSEAALLREPAPARLSDGMLTAYPHDGFDPRDFSTQPCEPTRLVDEGDVIDLGDRAFEVLHLPGHTPGSIALWEATTGVLFSGDVIYDGTLLDALPGSSIPDYRRTMERLRSLPVSVVHAGHGESFGAARMVGIIDGYLAARAGDAPDG